MVALRAKQLSVSYNVCCIWWRLAASKYTGYFLFMLLYSLSTKLSLIQPNKYSELYKRSTLHILMLPATASLSAD